MELSDAHLFDGYEAPIANAQSCEWSVLSNSRARILRYVFQRFETRSDAREEFNARKHSHGASCRFSKSTVEKLSDLGEEAFAAPCQIMKEQPIQSTTGDHEYQVGGLEIDFIIRNVIARFFWVGADYPAAVTTKDSHWLRDGKMLSYEQALPQAIKVAQSTLARFPQ